MCVQKIIENACEIVRTSQTDSNRNLIQTDLSREKEEIKLFIYLQNSGQNLA